MKLASKEYIIDTVYRTNILPIISSCNTSCIFCSHKQNPDGVEVLRMGKLGLSEFEEVIEFLSPDKKIIIGESATRIIEGEPLLHKNFIEIVSLVRERYEKTPIQITTNGILLDETIIQRLTELKLVEINLSVNCIDEIKRLEILGLKHQDSIKDKIALLKGRLPFSASAVIVPEIISAVDVEEMAAFLCERGASSLRLFIQGYTNLSKVTFDFNKVYEDIYSIVSPVRSKYDIPIMVEPSIIKSLACRVEGVVKGTPAFYAGIKQGDIITEVDASEVRTRVDGFNSAFKRKNPVIRVLRENQTMELSLKKPRNTSPGFVVLYDVNPDISLDIERLVSRYKADSILLMTSELAYGIMKELFDESDFAFKYDVLKVSNRFFGGSIKCAGLLTVEDVIVAVREYLNERRRPDLIVLPPAMFDYKGRDLLGRSINEIEKELNISVDTP